MLKCFSAIVAAKSTSDAYSSSSRFPPDPNSAQSTISTVEREINEAGGEATAIAVDVRDFPSVEALVQKTIQVSTFPPCPSLHLGSTCRHPWF